MKQTLSSSERLSLYYVLAVATVSAIIAPFLNSIGQESIFTVLLLFFVPVVWIGVVVWAYLSVRNVITIMYYYMKRETVSSSRLMTLLVTVLPFVFIFIWNVFIRDNVNF